LKDYCRNTNSVDDFAFLGSFCSTSIITLSIPLSIIASIMLLSALGHTINIMTLGGLALAVGILLDDAMVAIENINWNLEQGKEVRETILNGATQITIPALVSTRCICIVFIPMFYLGGVAQFLFMPLAQAVIFAMLASYILSRTFQKFTSPIPLIAPNMPSTLLMRRPDVIAIETRVIATNATIGVACAALFSAFNLSGVGSFDSPMITNLITKHSLFWSLGPTTLLSLSQPLACHYLMVVDSKHY
jgi:Cu/Ag efflux pump CusA